MEKPIVHLYTLCFNEEYMIPFFMDYYLKWVDKIVVLDNKSTDNSAALLAKYPNVFRKEFDSENEMRESELTTRRNTVWKNSRGKADFVIMCDIDEFLYIKNPVLFLNHLKQNQFSVVRPIGFDMISKKEPQHGLPIFDQVKEGARNFEYDKMVLFDPNKIENINYSPGAHYAIPEGIVKMYWKDPRIKLLHYRYLSEKYILEKNRIRGIRRSQHDHEHNFGYQYSLSEKQQLARFEYVYSNRKKVLD